MLAVLLLRLNKTLNGIETRLQILEHDEEEAAKESDRVRDKFLKVYEILSKISEKIIGLRGDVDLIKKTCESQHRGAGQP